ncbi:Response regulator transcription factor [Rhodovastum atsumiense]|nr:Response regulator transcription factor [Rhodovastum atsumiense]
MPAARILVISDIRILRDAVASDLASRDGIEVIGAASSGDGPRRAAEERVNLVLLDANIAGGAAFAQGLRRHVPGLRIVLFAVLEGGIDLVGWARTSINGVVARDDSAADLFAAVKGALRGEVFCSTKLTGILFAHVAALADRQGAGQATAALTGRESEIMLLVEQGLSNREIAGRIGIGTATVRNHLHRTFTKLGARSRSEAVARLRQRHG